MTLLLRILILVLAGIAILAAIVSALAGWQARARAPNYAYDVERQRARRSMQMAFFRAGVLLIVGLILLGVYGIASRPGGDETFLAEPTASPTMALTATVRASATPTTVTAPTDTGPGATATAPQALATETSTPNPTDTPTPVPTAIVDSEVGLYLREAPGGTQELELLADGAVLTLLPGRETVDGTEWQQIRTPNGNEGWVAVDFIVYQ